MTWWTPRLIGSSPKLSIGGEKLCDMPFFTSLPWSVTVTLWIWVFKIPVPVLVPTGIPVMFTRCVCCFYLIVSPIFLKVISWKLNELGNKYY